MTATTTAYVIDQPGLYDIDEAAYHSDPVPGGSLSSSGARKLLPPSCPALFKHERDHGQPPRREFDFGHAAHMEVLGVGMDTVIVQKTAKDGAKSNADDYRTKSAQEHADEIRAEGKTPLLAIEYEQVKAMAAALRQHPIAGALLQPDLGDAEQSAFWVDDETGIWCRARFDFLRNRATGRLVICDYKTSASVSLDHIQRSVHNYGYFQQASWYLDGAVACGIADWSAAFLFVFQMKTAPYLVTVVELDRDALDAGRNLNRCAREIYRDCMASGVWPGYSADVELVSLPAWALNRYSEENW